MPICISGLANQETEGHLRQMLNKNEKWQV